MGNGEILNGNVTIKRWKIYLGVVIALMVILTQVYVIASDRWDTVTQVITNTESIEDIQENNKTIKIKVTNIEFNLKKYLVDNGFNYIEIK